MLHVVEFDMRKVTQYRRTKRNGMPWMASNENMARRMMRKHLVHEAGCTMCKSLMLQDVTTDSDRSYYKRLGVRIPRSLRKFWSV
jgi:hypothetical protein